MATVVLALLMLFVGGAGAQSSAPTAGTRSSAPAVGVDRGNAVGATGPKDRSTVQQSSEPNAGEVRAGSRNGDSSAASAGHWRRACASVVSSAYRSVPRS